MSSIAACLMLCTVGSAQKLEVKSATSAKVVLAWSGTAENWIVERKSGSEFEKIGSATSAAFEDSKIAPYGTYTYRVRASATAAPSNMVTVGPPPLGLLKPAPAPKGDNRDSDDYGRRSALALDENGDPAFAFLWRDPNANNQPDESQIMFVRWNRALYKWDDPRKVAVTGETSPEAGEPISMAFEPGTGVAAMIFPVKDQKGFTFALSRDGGATWQTTAYNTGMEDEINSSTLIFSKGHFYLGINQYGDGPLLIDGEIGSDPGTWRKREPPVVGGSHHDKAPVGLAMNAQGNLYMAFFDGNVSGKDGFLFNVWQPDTGKTATVSDTNGNSPDSPNLKLAAGGGRLIMLMSMNPDDKDTDAGIWVSTSQDGATWTKAVRIPHDPNRSSGGSMSVAANSKGAIFVGFSSPSGGETGACGQADYATSSDGITWNHCGVGKDAHDVFTALSVTKNVIAAPDNSFYYLWNEGRSAKYGPGLLLWHTQ
ncbi:MAG TPA: sialidase family protein [Terracidiphilus sp.]|nr:sialidase family protein [Terracidiphilus sp.]